MIKIILAVMSLSLFANATNMEKLIYDKKNDMYFKVGTAKEVFFVSENKDIRLENNSKPSVALVEKNKKIQKEK